MQWFSENWRAIAEILAIVGAWFAPSPIQRRKKPAA